MVSFLITYSYDQNNDYNSSFAYLTMDPPVFHGSVSDVCIVSRGQPRQLGSLASFLSVDPGGNLDHQRKVQVRAGPEKFHSGLVVSHFDQFGVHIKYMKKKTRNCRAETWGSQSNAE